MKSISYENHFVAFVDILGYANLIDSVSDKEAITLIQKLDSLIKKSIDELKSLNKWNENSFQINLFSDCFCISILKSRRNFDPFMQLIPRIQKNFHQEGILLRGSLAIGKHYSNDRLIFSKALVEAYRNESSKAIYPRILIPRYFIKYVNEECDYDEQIWLRETYSWEDKTDRQIFIDYINFMPYDRTDEPNHNGKDLIIHKNYILEMLTKHRDNSKIFLKFEWLANYHNSWCLHFYPKNKKLKIDYEINEIRMGPLFHK